MWGNRSATIVLLVMIMGFVASCATTAVNREATPPEFRSILGKWVRSGTPYELTVVRVDSQGAAWVRYWNPTWNRWINVADASVEMREGGALLLLVVFRDEGYMGSHYRLLTQPNSNELTGTYYLASTASTVNVRFRRQ